MIEKTCTCTYVAGKLKTAEAPEGILRNSKNSRNPEGAWKGMQTRERLRTFPEKEAPEGILRNS